MSPCEQCDGTGLVRAVREGRAVSIPCTCQGAIAATARFSRVGVPPGFEEATLENFQAQAHTGPALLLARRYVEEFPTSAPAGLLFTGSVGTGKTHLAAGIARALAERGFSPLFVDVRDLLERLRHSYDSDARETPGSIMAPIWKADAVVIDELGAQRPSDWTFDTIEVLIGGLYNRNIPTIVTTNLANLPVGGGEQSGYQRAARMETLGDRIGMRMFSRLQQMCRVVEVAGPDWRRRK